MKIVIFSDLDGTLLDQHTYNFDSALPAVRLAKDMNIPVVFVSSKTRVEIEAWRDRLQNEHPFIVENGGGIYIPQGYFPFAIPDAVVESHYLLRSLGMPYERIRTQLVRLRDLTGIAVRGFGDMSIDEVGELAGLRKEEAERAKMRRFTEPFVFPAEPDERFFQAIEGEKLRWTQGQFFHLMGNHHKGRAVEQLRALYNRMAGDRVFTIGIGDSLNDLPFLLAVDQPVLIRKKLGSYDTRIEIPGLVRTRLPGSAGWSEAVVKLVNPEKSKSRSAG